MAAIELQYNNDEIGRMFNAIVARLGNANEAMSAIGDMVIRDIEGNFAAGGRFSSPDSIIGGSKKWRSHSKTTLSIKKRKGYKAPHQILVESGQLASSISKRVGKDAVEVGTNKEYAAMQHYGAKKGQFGIFDALVKAHKRKIKQKGQLMGKSGKLGKERNLTLDRSVRSHFRKMPVPWGNVPARPFMNFQPSTAELMVEVLADYILELDKG
ncbi:MAG: phage virion morphogenesis protein [Candidatus Riflebacteria bacterium]